MASFCREISDRARFVSVLSTNGRRTSANPTVAFLEAWLFGHRNPVLITLCALTAIMGWFALDLRMDAGFEKQLPSGHEYIKTFESYRDDLLGANRLSIAVKARDGHIWTVAGLQRLFDVTQAVSFLPHVARSSVQSLWTPNSFINEITEEGFRAEPVVPGTITAEQLNAATVDDIARSAAQGGFVGTLVARDHTSALIIAEINEFDAGGKRLDYVAFNSLLESQIRSRFEDTHFEIQIVGFAKQIGDIAHGAASVVWFCIVALLLTAVAVYWYSHSVRFTILPLACSMASLIWQFGTLKLLGFGLDPLAILVPFLVFSIGVSHGIQQINHIVREIAHGRSIEEAARASFSGLLVPGTLALVTAFVSFVTLLLIPIPMVRELAIAASLGVAYKIVTNLVMLPLMASLFDVPSAYADKVERHRVRRAAWLHRLAKVAEPANARLVLTLACFVLLAAAWESRGRVVGTLEPGAPELRADARYNLDAVAIAGSYDVGLDWLSVVFEAAADSCGNRSIGDYQDRFVWSLTPVEGIVSITSFTGAMRQYNMGYNEGNPKMAAVPQDAAVYSSLAAEVSHIPGLMRNDCSMTAVHLFLADHKATTISRAIDAVKLFRKQEPRADVSIRLASGNAGILAAIDEEIEASEMPMMLYVYAAIVALVFLIYRNVGAVLVCCLPLTIGTFVGYWFMKSMHIGLTVSTLPVMVLAVGIGVDYAFYIYNRIQMHRVHGQGIVKSVEHAILEVGVATIFTAITLAIGVATWSFSELKFQADMGKLLSFMFMVNMVMSMTVLPAMAVLLERWFPLPRVAAVSLAH